MLAVAIVTRCDGIGPLWSTAADQIELRLAPDKLDELATPKTEIDLFVLLKDVGVTCIGVLDGLVDISLQDSTPDPYSDSVNTSASGSKGTHVDGYWHPDHLVCQCQVSPCWDLSKELAFLFVTPWRRPSLSQRSRHVVEIAGPAKVSVSYDLAGITQLIDVLVVE